MKNASAVVLSEAPARDRRAVGSPDPVEEVRIVRSLEEIESIRPIWSSWKSDRDSDLDFCLEVVWTRKGVVRPHVVILLNNGRPEAMLVGRLEQGRMISKIGYVRLPGISCRSLVFSGILGNTSPGNCGKLIRSIMTSLRKGEADAAVLEGLPLQCDLHRTALGAPGPLSRDWIPAIREHEVMVVPDSIEEVYRRMSAKHRKNLRREVKHFFAQFKEASIVCYAGESQLDTLFRDAELIAKKTYQRALGAGFADNKSVRQSLGHAARRGWLRANVLYVGERPVAFWIGTLYRHTFVSEYMGYDPEFRRSSPGMVLIMRVIDGFCQRQNGDIVNELDFGSGSAEYKQSLSTRGSVEASVFIFSPSARGAALNLTRTVSNFIDRLARKFLGPAQRAVKKAWRSRLASKAAAASLGTTTKEEM